MEKSGEVISLEYEIVPNDFDLAGEASSNIKRILKQIGINSKVIRRVAVASYEAEINVIIHSYGGIMKAFISTKQIEIILEDSGPGIEDIELAMTEGYSTASDDVREMGFGAGMGLPNIKRCTDDLKISSSKKGTKLSMIFENN